MFSVKTKNVFIIIVVGTLVGMLLYYNCELVVFVITLEKNKKDSQHFTNARIKKKVKICKDHNNALIPPPPVCVG